jgi:hypothetical protein
MPWYRFWKKSGPMAGLDETFRHYDEEPSKDGLEENCEHWAEAMPGGHNTHYSYGFQKVSAPPLEFLQKRMESSMALRESADEDIRFCEAEIARTEKDAKKEGGG